MFPPLFFFHTLLLYLKEFKPNNFLSDLTIHRFSPLEKTLWLYKFDWSISLIPSKFPIQYIPFPTISINFQGLTLNYIGCQPSHCLLQRYPFSQRIICHLIFLDFSQTKILGFRISKIIPAYTGCRPHG